MGYVMVISLPLILVILIIAIGCYLIGRENGRTETATTLPITYGPPALPPPPVQQAHDQDPIVKSHSHV